MKKIIPILLITFLSLSASAERIKFIRIVNQKGELYDISSVAAFTSFKVGDEVANRETILSSIAIDVIGCESRADFRMWMLVWM